MVPLYAARVQDLGHDDVAVFKCGACGHTAELWPSLLIGGLGLKPTDKVLDLERRLRVPAVLCEGSGRGVDQMEGDEPPAWRKPPGKPAGRLGLAQMEPCAQRIPRAA